MASTQRAFLALGTNKRPSGSLICTHLQSEIEGKSAAPITALLPCEIRRTTQATSNQQNASGGAAQRLIGLTQVIERMAHAIVCGKATLTKACFRRWPTGKRRLNLSVGMQKSMQRSKDFGQMRHVLRIVEEAPLGICQSIEASFPEKKRTYPPSTVSDREALMELLSNCLTLIEAATATTTLLDFYDDYAEIVAAPFTELRAIAGVGEQGASLLKSVHKAAIQLAAAPLRRLTTVNDWETLYAYLNTSLSRERREVFRTLFLNTKNHVLSDQIMAEGTTNFVDVPVRTIAEKSLHLGATAVLLLHNHPSGDPAPSSNDRATTARAESALSLLGIQLHDHIIIGKSSAYSFKGRKAIPLFERARASC